MKRIIMILAVLTALLIPYSALALNSNFPIAGSYESAAGSREKAREYYFIFGNDEGIGHNDTWEVYTAPSLNAIRGANGKASCHTSGTVMTAGWDGAWLLVRYEKNNGGYRVGWVPRSTMGKHLRLKTTRSVNFAYWTVKVAQNCVLTDDPLYESEALAYASAGEELTYLAFYQYKNGREYAYVKGELNGQPICGFIPFDAIDW